MDSAFFNKQGSQRLIPLAPSTHPLSGLKICPFYWHTTSKRNLKNLKWSIKYRVLWLKGQAEKLCTDKNIKYYARITAVKKKKKNLIIWPDLKFRLKLSNSSIKKFSIHFQFLDGVKNYSISDLLIEFCYLYFI